MSDAIISIKDFCDAQARKARERYEAEMASYPWEKITVHYNDFPALTGINNPKRSEMAHGARVWVISNISAMR